MTETLNYTWEEGQLIVKTVHESADVAILRKIVSSMPGRELKIPRTGLTLAMKLYLCVGPVKDSLGDSADFVISAAGQIVSIRFKGLNETFFFSHVEERNLCFTCKQSDMTLILCDDLLGHILSNNLYRYHMQFYYSP